MVDLEFGGRNVEVDGPSFEEETGNSVYILFFSLKNSSFVRKILCEI